MPALRPTDAGSFAEAVYAQLEPYAWDDENQGWALLCFVGALGQLVQDIDTYAHDDGSNAGWTMLLDLDRIPDAALPWLGQFVGVAVDPTLTAAQQRQQIRAEGGMARGTLQSMVNGIQRHLINNKTVIIRERFTDAYNFDVITYAGDTYASNFDYDAIFNQEATYNALYNDFLTYSDIYVKGMSYSLDVYNEILAQKPAGLQFTYNVLTGQDYYEVWQDWPTYQDVIAHYTTYQAILDDAPVPHPFTFETVIGNTDYQELWNTYQTYQDVYDNDLTY